MFIEILKDQDGGIDDALGLMLEVFFFALIFVFAAVLVGSATAQAMSEIVAHHIASLVPVNGPNNQLVLQESQTEAHQLLASNSTSVVSARNQCGSASTCVIVNPCSAASPVCVVSVERRVMIPIVDSTITWYAKAVSIWPQNA